MTSEEFMSTRAYTGEASPLYGALNLPDWLDIGGDVRQVEMKQTAAGQTFQRNFMMQTDIEAAVHLSKRVSFVTLAGKYGIKNKWERRRSYLKIALNTQTTVRLGRFFPAYGIMVDDHTRLFRRVLGFDQGRESWNAEWSWNGEWGEIFISRVFGGRVSMEFKQDGRVRTDPDEEGHALRITANLSKYSQIGLSQMTMRTPAGSRREAYGIWSSWGISRRWYQFFQFDRIIRDKFHEDILFYRLGWVPFMGFHLLAEIGNHETNDATKSTLGYGIRWLPRPHWEFIIRRDYKNGLKIESEIAMVHYYF